MAVDTAGAQVQQTPKRLAKKYDLNLNIVPRNAASIAM
jgi:hypothetical protein